MQKRNAYCFVSGDEDKSEVTVNIRSEIKQFFVGAHMQFHDAQLTVVSISDLEIDPDAILAFQATSVSTYLVDAEQLRPFKNTSMCCYFKSLALQNI